MKQQACLIAAVGVSGLVCSQSQQKHCYVTQCYTLHYTHTSHINGGVKTEIQCDNAETVSTDNVWSTRSTPYQDEKQCSDVVMFVLHITLHLNANDACSSRQRYRTFIATTVQDGYRDNGAVQDVHRDNNEGSEIRSTTRATDAGLVAGACRWQHDETVYVYVLFKLTFVSMFRMFNTRCSNPRSTRQRCHSRRFSGRDDSTGFNAHAR